MYNKYASLYVIPRGTEVLKFNLYREIPNESSSSIVHSCRCIGFGWLQ